MQRTANPWKPVRFRPKPPYLTHSMINKLIITNFRNHKQTVIDTVQSNVIFIHGNNGAGKTAILEAISIFSCDKNMRNSTLSDLTKIGENNFSIFIELNNGNTLSVYKEANDTTKKAKFNNENIKLNELINFFKIIWLTPKDDRLFLYNTSDRRQFFDRLIGTFDNNHLQNIQNLNKLLLQRAFALKNKNNEIWLNSIDKLLSKLNPAIAATRIRYISEINYFLEDVYLSVNGIIENNLIDNNVEKNYFNYLKNNRILESDKMIIDGVHKTDFICFNKSTKLNVNLMSTGQQKKILLDIIIAHIKLINLKLKENPIVLLDDILSHLDISTQQTFLNKISMLSAQSWITSINNDILIDKALIITCENGQVKSIIKK